MNRENELKINTSAMRQISHTADLCVVGGGLTGLCAAVAAARDGIKVVLMQDRPVLGGNASSEIRMWVRGAHGLHNRETGIISELEQENIYRNPTLCYSTWDSVLWGMAYTEPNLELILNCSCCDAVRTETDGVSHIVRVTGWQCTTYTWHTVTAKFFADCSGDSVLAPLSGAKWRVGREATHEYGESIAHETADSKTMGMSCLIQARETGAPCTFIPPEWAYRYETDADFNSQMNKEIKDETRKINITLADGSTSISDVKITGVASLTRPHELGTSATNFWWLELGGDMDSIHDTEQVRDELLRVAYGIWDHVKNHGNHNADNWELEWVGFLPGKRESRRYIGAYVLTQDDISSGGHFDDIVAYGGWPMDDHNPAGFRSYLTSEPPSKLYPAPSPYGIPYRVLFGDEVDNLFFAGRNISATHAALSSTRVMATCSLLGQALGTAAAICVGDGLSPRGVYEKAIRKLQSKLQDAGCYLPWRVREIPALTRGAVLNLSDDDRGLLFNGEERPDEDGKINYVSLPLGGELTFDFGRTQPLHELRLMFDPDFSRKSVSPNKKMRVFAQRSCTGLDFRPVRVASTLVRAFEVYADGVCVYSDGENRLALRRIPLDVNARRLTVRFTATWGDDSVRLFSADVK